MQRGMDAVRLDAANGGQSSPPSPWKRPGAWFLRRFHGAPFNWSNRRKWRWALALILAVLAYPVLGTLALWTGFVEWVLKSEDLRVEIKNPAYTIWPGRVHMKHVRILANGTTQFILDGHDLLLDVRMRDLVSRRVHATELSAHDVTYHMRVQVKDTTGIERRIAAYPPLEGLPGAKVIREPAAKQTEEQDADWTVEVNGLDVGVKDLWFFEYRYLGKGRLRGGFLVGPNVMEVATAVQDLGPGEVRFGRDQVVATGLNGQIQADIPRVNPKEHADASFMELVTARVNLRTQVQSLAHAGAYTDGIEFSGGKGPLVFDLHMDRGTLGGKSQLRYQTDSINLKGAGFGVGTDFLLEFDAAGSKERLPLASVSAKSTYVSLSRKMRSFTLQVHGHKSDAQLDTIRLSRATDLKSAKIHMPDIRSEDLRDLPVLLPEGAPVEVRGGQLRGSLELLMDEKYWARGAFASALNDFDVNAAGVSVNANVGLKTNLALNPKLATYQAENLAFTLRELDMRAGDRSVDDWWMNLSGKQLTFKGGDRSRFDGVLSVRTRDMDPLLKALAEKDVISDLIPFFTSLNDFRASAIIHGSGPITDVSIASESEIWDAAGRVYKNAERTLMAIVFGGQAVSLGIANTGDGLEIMPFAKTTWLNEQLRAFPKPLVLMPGHKP
jgi:hypothetical protein